MIRTVSDPVPDDQGDTNSVTAGDDPGQVEFVEHDPTRVRLRVETPHASWLVLSEAFDTNWKATLDSHETAVHPANLGSRAVHVPPGTHELLFTYEPFAFKLGAGLALVAAFGVGLVVLGQAVVEAWAIGRGECSRVNPCRTRFHYPIHLCKVSGCSNARVDKTAGRSYLQVGHGNRNKTVGSSLLYGSSQNVDRPPPERKEVGDRLVPLGVGK